MNLQAYANKSCGLYLTLLGSALFNTAGYALPFNITPDTSLPFPTVIAEGATVYATYVVQNNTDSERDNNYVKYLPPNVSVVGGTCFDYGLKGVNVPVPSRSTFNLNAFGSKGDRCTIDLAIKSGVNPKDSNPHHHLFVCFPGGKTCAGTPVPLTVAELKGVGYSGLADVVNIGKDIYVGGANSDNLADLWKYDLGHFSNAYIDTDPTSYVQALAVANNNSVFIGGDVFTGSMLDNAWVKQYFPMTRQTVDTGFFDATGATDLSALVFGGNTLYAGGVDSTGNHGQVWWYKNNTWANAGIDISDPNITSVTALAYYAPRNVIFDAVINSGGPGSYAQVQMHFGGMWLDTGLPTPASALYLREIDALVVDSDGNVYAGGSDSNFNAAVWKFDGFTWTPLPSPSNNGQIYALAFNSNGTLYAGGYDGENFNGQIWYYDGSSWISTQLAGSFEVFSMTIDPSDKLYAVGLASFGITGGIWSLNANA